jgi:hypothetical protein
MAILLVEQNSAMALPLDGSSFANGENPGEIADVAIQWRFGDWPNVESRVLLQAPLIAACGPDLLKRSPVANFAAHPLPHVGVEHLVERATSDVLSRDLSLHF